jgi:hypothetical protein
MAQRRLALASIPIQQAKLDYERAQIPFMRQQLAGNQALLPYQQSEAINKAKAVDKLYQDWAAGNNSNLEMHSDGSIGIKSVARQKYDEQQANFQKTDQRYDDATKAFMTGTHPVPNPNTLDTPHWSLSLGPSSPPTPIPVVNYNPPEANGAQTVVSDDGTVSVENPQ